MKRPTFFISSTIFDFADLRSGLKYFLEAQGCRVLASECNDFPVDRNAHSYQACLTAIEEADYFILLVGTRVGGWYDESKRISITQSEYRRARELQDAGRLKLVNFVRSSVWTVREDRRELAKFLASIPVEPALAKTIAGHPGKFAEDAEFIASFLAEVGRNAETKVAVRKQSPAPAGNWIHLFSSFKEIVDVLQAQLFLATPLDELSLRSVLRVELRTVLAQCLLKLKDQVISPRPFIDRFHERHPIGMPDRNRDQTVVDTKSWRLLSTIAIHLLTRKLETVVLDQAIASPAFLKFDADKQLFVATDLYLALGRLRGEISRFNHACTTDNLAIVFGHSPRARPDVGERIDLPTVQLVGFLHLLDRWANVVGLCESLLAHFDGAPFVPPVLRPDSPVQGMQEGLDSERVDPADLDVYLHKLENGPSPGQSRPPPGVRAK